MTAPADWQDFAEMTGGASAALTGLLFVAVSVNASRIAGHQGLRASAAQTLVLFMAPLVMAAALLAPDQADWALGAELIAVGLITSWILLGIRRVKRSLTDDDRNLIAIFNRRGPNVMVMLLFVASGIMPGLRPARRPLPAASRLARGPGQRRAQRLALPAPAKHRGVFVAAGSPRRPRRSGRPPGESSRAGALFSRAAGEPLRPFQLLDSQRSMQASSSSVSTGLVT